jgi:hypothetical protein
MTEQLKRLSELEINLDSFYVVTFRETGIDLQGKATEQIIRQCKKLVDFEFVQDHYWLSGSKNGINITLTF